MVLQPGQPERLGLVDQQPEDPAAAGQLADLGVLLGADAVHDEVRQLAVGADHAQGAVLGTGELARRHHDPVEHVVHVEVGAHRDDGVQQGSRLARQFASGVAARVHAPIVSAGTKWQPAGSHDAAYRHFVGVGPAGADLASGQFVPAQPT